MIKVEIVKIFCGKYWLYGYDLQVKIVSEWWDVGGWLQLQELRHNVVLSSAFQWDATSCIAGICTN
jgi:hypothetical protein